MAPDKTRAVRCVTLPIRAVIDCESTVIDPWRRATELANWSQLQLVTRDDIGVARPGSCKAGRGMCKARQGMGPNGTTLKQSESAGWEGELAQSL